MNNSITIVGRVGDNPKAIVFEKTENKVVKFSVAVKEYSANSDEDKTMWLDVESWNLLGDRVLKTVTKGREVVVTGRLALTTYTTKKNGVEVQVTKPVIKLQSYHLCGKKPAREEQEQAS